jgi:hypothetical protein
MTRRKRFCGSDLGNDDECDVSRRFEPMLFCTVQSVQNFSVEILSTSQYESWCAYHTYAVCTNPFGRVGDCANSHAKVITAQTVFLRVETRWQINLPKSRLRSSRRPSLSLTRMVMVSEKRGTRVASCVLDRLEVSPSTARGPVYGRVRKNSTRFYDT